MNNKIFIYAEGRDDISSFMANDMKRATLEHGWTYRQLLSMNLGDLLDRAKMEKTFPEGCSVFLRNLPKNDNTDVMALTSWLNNHGRVTLNFNAVGGLLASNDKQYQQAILFDDPRTRGYLSLAYDVSSPQDVMALVKARKLRFPILLKPRDGSVGKGIEAVENEEGLNAISRWNLMAAQNFIDSDYDWRVYVIGGVAVGALRRGGKEGKKYNFEEQARGIEKSKEKDPEVLKELFKIASAITAVAGLEYGGCDIIRDKNTGKYYALEVNTAAVWEGGYNTAIEVDLATKIIEWCDERNAAKNKPKYQSIREYFEKRLEYLSPEARARFESIINWNDDTLVKGDDDALLARLQHCYKRIRGRKVNLAECQYLIDEVERTPLCWAGNFIGSSVWGKDGILEDSVPASAYYLAICEKCGKIAKVN